MTEQRQHPVHRVVIGGGGIAALEALVALHDLARVRVDVTLVAPTDELTIKALSVEQPFGRGGSRAYDIEQACADHGARFIRDAVHAVQRERRTLVTRGGAVLPYDSALLALGSRPVAAFGGVLTFRGAADADAAAALLAAVERGEAERLAFVVPDGPTWPLPLYELALKTADRAADLGLDTELRLITPEAAPLGLFGAAASAQVAGLLRDRGIALRTHAHVRAVVDGTTVVVVRGSVEHRADRVVAVPVLHGPRVQGLPADPHGFLPVDEHGAVPGAGGVFAAGDGTTVPIKQGGVAAQQAEAAARAIACRAGADVAPRPFRPRLGGELRTGRAPVPLGDHGDEEVRKVAAPRLMRYLARLDAGGAGPVPEPVRVLR